MKIFVTGGSGFLGLAIVKQLRDCGHEVSSFSRNECSALTGSGIQHFQGDISAYQALKNAMTGCDAVFHVAAKTGIHGSYEDFYQVNVRGTENVLLACRELKIRHLVFTSSPSVVFNGKDSEGQDESLPYSRKYNAYYPQTKAIAERLVLNANDAFLKTVSLRPHLIWGPGDKHYIPKLFSKAQSGKLFQLGKSPKLVDCIYIENAARAHLQAFNQLQRDPGKVEGKTYFISQGKPIPMSELMNRLLATGGYPPVKRYLSPTIARFVGRLLETIYRVFAITSEPPITVFLAQQLSTSHWYNIAAAKKDFGYEAEISLEEGMERLRAWVLRSSMGLSENHSFKLT